MQPGARLLLQKQCGQLVTIGGITYARQLVRVLPYEEVEVGELGVNLPGFDLDVDSGSRSVFVYRLIRVE